jgi:hypothetical protein
MIVRQLLRAFDYLSTVSGGAYIGSLQDQNTATRKIVFSAGPEAGKGFRQVAIGYKHGRIAVT